MSLDWDKVTAHALAQPGAAMSTSYGKPAVKVNGHAIVAPGREAGSFVLLIDMGTVDLLKETDPDTYWQTLHYEGWPAVLVRYASDDPERVLATIERAADQARARKPPRPHKTR